MYNFCIDIVAALGYAGVVISDKISEGFRVPSGSQSGQREAQVHD